MKYRYKNSSATSGNGEPASFDVYSKLVTQRILFLSGEIDSDLATGLAATFLWLDQENPESEITLYINSPGGVVEGLFTIYDTMQFIRAPVKTICIGEAMSSAAVILCAGTKGKRFAYPSSKIMIHNILVDELSGTTKEIEEESKRCKELNQTLMQVIARHTGQPLRRVKRDCQKDKYFNVEEAIKYGLIDSVIQPSKNIPEIIDRKK